MYEGGGIYQNVYLPAGDYTVSATAEIASSFEGPGLANSSGGIFEVLLDGGVVASYDFGAITAGTTERSTLAASLSLATEGSHELRIRITRPFQPSPYQYLGNVVLSANAPIVTTSEPDGPSPDSSDSPNRPPTADANGPYTVAEDGAVTLHGSGSDPDHGARLTFAWDLNKDGSFETLEQNPTFSGSGVSRIGVHQVVLQVCDEHNACDTDQTRVRVIRAR